MFVSIGLTLFIVAVPADGMFSVELGIESPRVVPELLSVGEISFKVFLCYEALIASHFIPEKGKGGSHLPRDFPANEVGPLDNSKGSRTTGI